MCQITSSLAEHSADRYIVICEHNIVHTGWDHLSFHFHLNDFRAFVQALEEMRAKFGYPTETCHNYVSMVEPQLIAETDTLPLRIGRVRVNFLPIDFLLLVDLVREAVYTLDNYKREDIDNGAIIAHNYRQFMKQRWGSGH